MIDPGALEDLERLVVVALDEGNTDGLEIIGYGEISTVLGTAGKRGPVVAKRLPSMSPAKLSDYRTTFDRYLDALASAGVNPSPSEIHAVGANEQIPYCTQPLYGTLLVDELRDTDEDTAAGLSRLLVTAVGQAVDEHVGLDAQISNWAIEDGRLVYLDVTTPLLRDHNGGEMLDVEMFMASLPWAMRGMVRRFLLGPILDPYYDRRQALLNAAANLYKEGLDHVVEVFMRIANEELDDPLTAAETTRYYRTDAVMWALLQRLRTADRWWQRNVRRRRYPFLLPGPIER